MRLISERLRPYRILVVGVVMLQLVGTIASLFLPSLNADIIDNGVVAGDTGYIVRVGAVMLAVAAVQIVTTMAGVRLAARTSMAVGRDIRSLVFRQVGTFSAREVGLFGAPSLITRNTNDVQQVQMLVMTALTMMITAPILGLGGVVMAVREEVGLSWLVAVIIPVLVVLIGLIAWRMIPGYRAMQARLDDLNRILREQTSGIRVVRAFVREPFEAARFDRANTGLTDVSIDVGRWMAALFPTMMLIMNVSTVAVLWFGGIRLNDGQMLIGSLTAYITYVTQILMGVMMSTMTIVMAPRASVAAERICEVLDTETSVVPPADGTGVGPTADGTVAHHLHRPPGPDHGHHRFNRGGQDHLVEPDPPTVRRHLGHGQRRWRARGRLRARGAVVDDRPGSAEGLSVLGHGGLQPPLRQARCHR